MKTEDFLKNCEYCLIHDEGLLEEEATLLLKVAWHCFACVEQERGTDYAGKLLDAHPWPEELD